MSKINTNSTIIASYGSSESIIGESKIDCCNISLKTPPSKTNSPEKGYWKKFFWIELPKREHGSNMSKLRSEYKQVIDELKN
jgi:hypothetical protein